MGEGVYVYGIKAQKRSVPSTIETGWRFASTGKNRTRSQIMREYHLARMQSLKGTKVVVNGNGHPMKVGFNKHGNKHLYNDAHTGNRGIQYSDLSNMATILAGARFVRKAGLRKPRPKDEIKRFYYYKTTLHGSTVYLHVAEKDFVNKRGKVWHSRYLYATTRRLK